MKGTRPLDNNEIRLVSACFGGTYEVRNRGLFMLGVSTGGRISELLSLTIGDVWQNGKAVTDLLYDRTIVKGGEVSRAVPVNIDGRNTIDALLAWHSTQYQKTEPDRPLFPSRQKSGTVPMHRQTAHDILKTAFTAAGLNGKLATHSLRKSFAQRLYDKTGDIYLVQELLGHRNISTTQKYLGVNYADAKAAVEAIALISESYRITFRQTHWKRSTMKHSKANSHAEDTTSPNDEKTRPPQRLSKSDERSIRCRKLCLKHLVVNVPKQNCVIDTTTAKTSSQIGQFITQVYHQKRPHSALGYLTPIEFQKQTFS